MKKGDLFYYDVTYEDNPSKSKTRPVLLLKENEDNILLLVSTTSKPRKHPIRWYDKYKIPIHNWRKSGLPKASWCLGKNLISLPRKEVEAILTEDDYIGRIHFTDFNFIIEELERIHNA